MKCQSLITALMVSTAMTVSAFANVKIVAPESGKQGQQQSAQSGVVVEKIEILGNKRIPVETITVYATIKIGGRANDESMDDSLKALYDTGLFSDVKVTLNGNVLRIEVVENPVINRIAFENNSSFPDDKLSPLLTLQPRQVFTRSKLQNDVDTIIQAYRALGRFSATVEPKIIKRNQNRIDLVYVVSEGEHTKVDKITFIGNKTFSDSTLRNVVNTSESKWWRFFSTTDTYDPEKLSYDKELVRQYYVNRGFIDVQVKTAVAELSEQRDSFFVSYTLKEGIRYKYGTFKVVSNITDVDTDSLLASIDLDPENWYSGREVDKQILKLTKQLNDADFPFVDVKPRVRRDRKAELVNIEFVVDPAPRKIVEKVDIRGNLRTRDSVIRSEVTLLEGDPMNQARYRETRQNIEALGHFASVETEVVPGSSPDKVAIVVNVEEKSTGNIIIGGGYSSDDGATLELGLEETNLGGSGRGLNVRVATGGKTTAYSTSITQPYFMNRDWTLRAGVSFKERKTRKIKEYAYKTDSYNASVFYDIDNHWSQSLGYSYQNFRIGFVGAKALASIKKAKKKVVTSSVTHSITYADLDDRINPTDGYSATLSNTYAGVGGTVKYIQNVVDGRYYHPISENKTLMLAGSIGDIQGFDGQKVRAQDRFSLGGYNLRGFTAGGAGPRTAKGASLGGTQLITGTSQVYFNDWLPKEVGIKPYVFMDAGKITDPDTKLGAKDFYKKSVRSSYGLGWSWKSPVGPMEFSFARILKKEAFDKTQRFRFDLGFRF